MSDVLINQIDAVLPQTQCGQCSFSGCRPYAAAIVAGQADINQCPPGDVQGIQLIADLLGVKPKPLNTAYGVSKPKAVALIDEDICIGCTFCIQSCPVDAIVGAAKQMHTVIAAECTGCELCLAPCPVDCISMVSASEQATNAQNMSMGDFKKNTADLARARYQFRLERLEREKQVQKEKQAKRGGMKKTAHMTSVAVTMDDRKKEIVQAAIKRALAARNHAANKKNGFPHESS